MALNPPAPHHVYTPPPPTPTLLVAFFPVGLASFGLLERTRCIVINSVVRENPLSPPSPTFLQQDSTLSQSSSSLSSLLLLLLLFSLLLSAVRSLFCVWLLRRGCSGSISPVGGGNGRCDDPDCLSDCCGGLWAPAVICSVSEQPLRSRTSVHVVRVRRPDIVTHTDHTHTPVHAYAHADPVLLTSPTLSPF